MKNIFKNGICILFFYSYSCITTSTQNFITTNFFYNFALVRDLSNAFENSLKLNSPIIPIDLHLAKKQHENYITILKELIPNVIQLEASHNHPDCNFIEDTAIIINDIAVISRMGAIERRGEEIAIADAIKTLKNKKIIYIQAPGTMDGGDILYTGNHLFVGFSARTNEDAFKQLKEIFRDKIEVVGIPVSQRLHLKSLVSCFDFQTLIIADTNAGKEIKKYIEELTNGLYKCILVPDSTASNVLRIGSNLIIQEGFLETEKILKKLCDENSIKLVKLNMSELIKADGALTCGCIVFN
ncbi:hypothetical protein HYV11_01870 [Candidatus Dependentiae bacterium]|nr:hypothetical protein [Candidatus Dependentiae bacterium]